jgi:hypothetical protein
MSQEAQKTSFFRSWLSGCPPVASRFASLTANGTESSPKSHSLKTAFSFVALGLASVTRPSPCGPGLAGSIQRGHCFFFLAMTTNSLPPSEVLPTVIPSAEKPSRARSLSSLWSVDVLDVASKR